MDQVCDRSMTRERYTSRVERHLVNKITLYCGREIRTWYDYPLFESVPATNIYEYLAKSGRVESTQQHTRNISGSLLALREIRNDKMEAFTSC